MSRYVVSSLVDGATADQIGLWDRIQAIELDQGGARFAFTDRLARDNGWSTAFARSVVSEYKRFLFLAIAAGHPVTPSDEVDQAWHLHLTYSHSYWDELCGEVLGRPLHHGPTKGGHAEGEKFDDWYSNTLASYGRFFGHAPPASVWPAAKIRFGEAKNYQRVNKTHHWVVPKPRLRHFNKPVLAAGSAAVVTACASSTGVGGGGISWPTVIVTVLLLFGFIGWNRRSKPSRRRRAGGDADTGCGTTGQRDTAGTDSGGGLRGWFSDTFDGDGFGGGDSGCGGCGGD